MLNAAGRCWRSRATRSTPTISNEVDLQEHLGLDARPSELLEDSAESQPVLLVLDQLDALAGYIDLRTARLNILLNLVRRLGPN